LFEEAEMRKVLSIIAKEIREAIPAMVFFFVVFQLVHVTKILLLTDYQITATGATVATVGALIVAKAILIADKLPFINVFSGRPAIYTVIWKTIIYGLITLLFRFVEELIPTISKYGSLGGASQHLIKEVSWPRFWGFQLWLVVSLVLFCIVLELVDEFGADRIKNRFFRSKPA
jgi:hypothetical protein